VAAGVVLAVLPADDGSEASPTALAQAPRDVLVFSGRGFGHGVGMPQYGARGAALAGWDAARILGYYYSGTTIGTAPERELRVLVAEGRPEVVASRDKAWRAVDETGARPPLALAAGAGYRLAPEGAGLAISDAGGATVTRFPGAVRLEPAEGRGSIALDGTVYRGRVRVLPHGGALDAVNLVGLEDYLLGVVPREMPPSWADDAPAAVRAQAVAARTYALATRSSGGEHDLYDDQRSQVYGGRTAEDPRTSAAVRATRGQVVTFDGAPIVAFFSSSSGGRTEAGGNVFPGVGDAPYLRSVPDPFDDASPYHRWAEPMVVSGRRLAEALGLPGPAVAVDAVRRGASPRVLEARAVSAWPFPGQVDVSGARLRAVLGLPDTWFEATHRTVRADGGAVAPRPGAEREEVWLAVLNCSGAKGAAGRAAERAEAMGYRAVEAANAPPQSGASVAYYRPGGREAAERAARDLGLTGGAARLPDDPALAAEAPAGAQVIAILGSG
jgi:stage II sporulation protein D